MTFQTLTGLFDGRPADFLFMILFNGLILIVSFCDFMIYFSIISSVVLYDFILCVQMSNLELKIGLVENL